ncbi:hypothetical protein sphantq_00695 [Sphingobium sp. AntQ-1]|uniref:EAL domain-containing protein n=1 Tax=Sphingomonas bisphenolicum TaxID=296544 RepID=A0ABN5WEZ2_9SPHN|nr:hypothetical protein sphantq_00695 [Sphingobium sp. AntQ-1]BBF70889.1 hypothetical protein SBA_ch1_30890 [Sphingomonas bisphenolicum]
MCSPSLIPIKMGFGTAVDDFGAGYAGLGLLAKFQTDYIKLNMDLFRGWNASMLRRLITRNLCSKTLNPACQVAHLAAKAVDARKLEGCGEVGGGSHTPSSI